MSSLSPLALELSRYYTVGGWERVAKLVTDMLGPKQTSPGALGRVRNYVDMRDRHPLGDDCIDWRYAGTEHEAVLKLSDLRAILKDIS